VGHGDNAERERWVSSDDRSLSIDKNDDNTAETSSLFGDSVLNMAMP
jgi:hypothetical protein